MSDSKYGRVYVEGKDIPEGEPLFLIRGQDRLGPDAVEYYARLRRAMGDEQGYIECMNQAALMRAWPTQKWPD